MLQTHRLGRDRCMRPKNRLDNLTALAMELDEASAWAQVLGWAPAAREQDLGLALEQDLGLVSAPEVGTDHPCARSRPAALPGNQTTVLLPEPQAQSSACPRNPQTRTWSRSEGKLRQTAGSESSRRTRPES